MAHDQSDQPDSETQFRMFHTQLAVVRRAGLITLFLTMLVLIVAVTLIIGLILAT